MVNIGGSGEGGGRISSLMKIIVMNINEQLRVDCDYYSETDKRLERNLERRRRSRRIAVLWKSGFDRGLGFVWAL